MTEIFKASNGWYTDADGHIRGGEGMWAIDESEVDAVEQFFQEKRDAELGRWRDPERIEFVCYDMGTDMGERIVRVMHEYNGLAEVYSEVDVHPADPSFQGAAGRYFRAHPQHKPLPSVEGFYVNRSLFAQKAANASILVRFEDGGWAFLDAPDSWDATDIAQEWHDAGQLVRLAPVESEDNDD